MKKSTLNLFQFEVTQEDIDEMYSRYDSGMSDRTTANAVSLALRKKLREGNLPRIVFASRHHACRLLIGEDWFPLPQDLYWWLEESNQGKLVFPTSFCIVLPEDFLLPPIASMEEKNPAIAA